MFVTNYQRPVRVGAERPDRQAADAAEQAGIGGANRLVAIGGANRLELLDETIGRLGNQHSLAPRAFPISEVRFGVDCLGAGSAEFKLTERGRRRLYARFRIPGDYVENLSPELRAAVLNHYIQQGDYRRVRLDDKNSSILLQNDEVFDFCRNDLYSLTDAEVLSTARVAIGPEADKVLVRRCDASGWKMEIDLVAERVAKEARPGDILLGGLRITHSATGDFATTVNAFVLRLVCMNGLTRMECTRGRCAPRTRRIDRAQPNAHELQVDQVRRLTQEAWGRLGDTLEGLGRLKDERFSLGQLDRFLQQARLHSAPLTARLAKAWEAEGSEPTAYGILNALTRLTSHDADLSERRRFSLERLAGLFASHSSRICPHCLSVLRGGNRMAAEVTGAPT